MAQLTPDAHLAEQRVQGRTWAELAFELGKTPEAFRKRYERAVERVAKQLNFDGTDRGMTRLPNWPAGPPSRTCSWWTCASDGVGASFGRAHQGGPRQS